MQIVFKQNRLLIFGNGFRYANIVTNLIFNQIFFPPPQVTANDADVDRPNNIIYFLTGPGINAENPSESNFDINKATGEIFVLKVSDT